ncbi:putative extracelular cellulose binding protein (Cip2) [Aspergillus novofumigatus IBT 16806]|uniref:(4-O-methyl)-D-glucuronate--lignin esterase n=1 Tax=Aspergillus novofumigatus (strain IBT 16806) TaxID=1392255 RepID=A0A2I1CBD6_ASPN1|nr:uncharacterized protein P174DRAFT_458496 [Aspergillus novofumigatus IBT 16806]PKX94886.1 hypothetical protein P174DRAFT_458496 [Aspergillus novofumigatus IBT 16806]
MMFLYPVLLSLISSGALAATCPSLPSSPQLQAISTLPDPFSWYPLQQSGRVTTLSDWQCRQSHISTLLQQLELGTKPPAPSSHPLPPGVATITFDNSQIAQQTDQSSRGKGLFYTLYGANHPAGAMMAWAWATSLIIDRLEATPAARINTARIGVTGCSRNGKGALVAGAFDSRIALTVPQESGTGGSGCWRLAAASEGAPQNVQTAGEIVQENVWFSTAFNAYANNVDRLPFDHHMLAGLIAPRGLLSIDNAGYQWLGPWSSLGCMGTARLIWQAMGVPDRMGYSMSTNHPHCSFPDQQREDLFAFINRFLLGMEVNTTVQKNYAGIAFDSKPWVNWQVPTLT